MSDGNDKVMTATSCSSSGRWRPSGGSGEDDSSSGCSDSDVIDSRDDSSREEG